MLTIYFVGSCGINESSVIGTWEWDGGIKMFNGRYLYYTVGEKTFGRLEVGLMSTLTTDQIIRIFIVCLIIDKIVDKI